MRRGKRVIIIELPKEDPVKIVKEEPIPVEIPEYVPLERPQEQETNS